MAIRPGDTGRASEPGLHPASDTRDVALGAGKLQPGAIVNKVIQRLERIAGGPPR